MKRSILRANGWYVSRSVSGAWAIHRHGCPDYEKHPDLKGGFLSEREAWRALVAFHARIGKTYGERSV